MDLNGSHRKWPTAGRRCPSFEQIFLLFASMSIFSIMMLINVDVSKGGSAISWAGDLSLEQNSRLPAIRQMAMPAMKTIVAYSPEKQAEMDRKYPIFCDVPPKPPTGHKKDGVWQDITNMGISLYSGYYDDRTPEQPFIRILAVTNGTPIEELGSFYCQTWTTNEDAALPSSLEIVEATVTQIWWSEWDPGTRDTVTPLLVSCALTAPKDTSFITTVTEDPCESSSFVLAIKPPNFSDYVRNFTVCVKDMSFQNDISVRLVEWFELLKLLGAEKIDLYVGYVPNTVRKVLEYYSQQGIASVRDAPRPPAASLWQRRRDHLLAYNDCLYRNLRISKYIVPLDIDEMIVPRNVRTWNQLLEDLQPLEIEAPGAASLAVSNAFFFDSFNVDYTTTEISNKMKRSFSDTKYFLKGRRKYGEPNTADRENKRNETLREAFEANLIAADVKEASKEVDDIPHTLKHLHRSALVSPAPEYSKSFVSTSRALTVFNHYALGALAGAERARAVPPSVALLHHYKAACQPALVDCQLYTTLSVKDDTLLRLAGDLVVNINKVLKKI